MIVKDTKLSIRISKTLLEEYKQYCEENSLTMSKRILTFMRKDLELWKTKKLQLSLYENNLEEYLADQEKNKKRKK